MPESDQDENHYLLASLEQRVLILRGVEVGFLDNLKYGLKEARFYSQDALINDSIFPIPRPEGRKKIDIIATTFEEDMTSNRALEVIETEGLAPLSFHTTIEFCHDERSWRYNLIPCLQNKHGNNPLCPGLDLIPVIQHFPSNLGHEKLKRVCDVGRFGQVWPAGTLFPCTLWK